MYTNSSCIRINNTTVNFDNGIDGQIILMAISIEAAQRCNLLLVQLLILSEIDLLLSLSTPSSHSVSSST